MNFGVFIAFCGFTATELASGISVCSPLRIIIFTQTLPGTLLLKFSVNLRNLRETLCAGCWGFQEGSVHASEKTTIKFRFSPSLS